MGKVSGRFWLCSAITLISSIVSASYSIVGLLAARNDTFAQYAASRSVSLLLVVLLAVLLRHRTGLLAMAWCMSCVQLLDGCIGFAEHNPFETYGPLAFALINGILAYALWKETRQNAGSAKSADPSFQQR